MKRPLRIAMLTHSTNPRGGVVHAMQLSEALSDLGHEVVLHAPDRSGAGFFRDLRCGAAYIKAGPAPQNMTDMVKQRIAEYVRHFEAAGTNQFDIFHAHDGISGNALATLKARGQISDFARTVHHIDEFSDPELMHLQQRSIDCADHFFTVSNHWRDILQGQGLKAVTVGNGVDMRRFRPEPDANDALLKERLGLQVGPVFLAVGGVEARKNTCRILEAFIQLRTVHPGAQLVIAGGVSLLDHTQYQQQFQELMVSSPAHAKAVVLTGAVADEDMPALYRLADTLVFPSIKEGFGLVVLEALASGTPAIVPGIAPFTEYLSDEEAIRCAPLRPSSIAEAMLLSLVPAVRERFAAAGLGAAARHSWADVAKAHLETYQQQMEPAHA